jgi:hypothetical protein
LAGLAAWSQKRPIHQQGKSRRKAMHKKFVVLIVAAMFLSGCMGSGTGSTDQPPYTASGQILSGGNQISLSDVKLVVEPGGKVVDVDSSGTFTIHGLKGTVSIVPNLEGWKFDPESRTIKGARSNLTFTASKDEGETSGLVVLVFSPRLFDHVLL